MPPCSNGEPYQGFIQNDTVRIHFGAVGKGPLLIFVHGHPDNSETWKAQVAEFSNSHTVVCPTLRGFPPSDVPDADEAYGLEAVVGDLVAVLKWFESPQAVFIGHDFGGAAVQILALVQPALVKGLILINAPLLPRFNTLVHADKDQQKLSEYTIAFAAYNKGDPQDVEDKIKHIRSSARRNELRTYLSNSPVHGMMAYYKQNYPLPPCGQNSELSKAKFRVPTLIIWGLEDEYFSPKHVDGGLEDIYVRGLKVVKLEGAGHWSFQEQPDKVNMRCMRSKTEHLRDKTSVHTGKAFVQMYT